MARGVSGGAVGFWRGGQTASLLFLGEKINTTGAYKGRARVRSVNGLIGVSDGAWNGETPAP